MISELARKTYNQIFFNDLHILTSDEDSIISLVENNMFLLDKKIDRYLFLEELKQLFYEKKIVIAQGQIYKYGQVLMSDYEIIKAIYNRLSDLNIVKSVSVVQSLDWRGSNNNLKTLFDFLIVRYIQKDTEFKELENLFSENIEIPQKPVQWISANRLLVYLFEELLKNNLIVNKRYPSIIENLKLFVNKSGKFIKSQDLTTAKNAYLEAKFPKDSELVKDLISSLKH